MVPEGLGTALKPAYEPIILARKPLKGTVAENVMAYGTGALNVDGCRIGTTGATERAPHPPNMGRTFAGDFTRGNFGVVERGGGRWPANLILDDTAASALDQMSGESASSERVGRRAGKAPGRFGAFAGQDAVPMGHSDRGGASRFFYTAKADRDPWNDHPTLKPVDLMRWLVRLVTPPGGTVLDPFMGSGTTGVAARAEGFSFIGIERDAHYMTIAKKRLRQPRTEGEDAEIAEAARKRMKGAVSLGTFNAARAAKEEAR